MRSCPARIPFLASTLMVLLLGCREDAESPTSPETAPALATTTAALAFAGMTAGWDFSCGVTTDNHAYCWGRNDRGQLGDGSTTDRLRPVPVAGGLRFRQLSAGSLGTCGVTTDFRAYCWGLNQEGELGDGTTTQHLIPVAVAGGHKFSQVEINFGHTCGLSYPDNKAYCWGDNDEGELGVGTNTGPEFGLFGAFSSKPVAVLGGLTFRRVTAGYYHSCGVTTSNKIYCWGLNKDGQLGDGTEVYRRKTPQLVTGGLAFSFVDAGSNYTCGVTTGTRAYCWGYGKEGQRGDGGVTERVRAPRAVFGNHPFTRVSAAYRHTCAVTSSNQAWCWGINANGQLGDGTTSNHLTPHLVAGGLAFNQVSAGLLHTCGRTTSAVGYCWGWGFRGQLGNGSTSVSTTPAPVSGPN
jgi:alpha-tubulin suppressor-like RCC1 family protein